MPETIKNNGSKAHFENGSPPLLIFLAACLFVFLPVMAGAVHKGAGGLVCGSCHTMHSSQGGAAMEGGSGKLVLVRGNINSRAEMHKLCLQCHASNGSAADVSHEPQGVKAPKVYSSATWTDDDAFNLIGAGGNFSSELDGSWAVTTPQSFGFGHSLGASDVMPPGAADGDTALPYLTCINCHDPHGIDLSNPEDNNVNLYRNLKVNAIGAGANSGVKLRDLTTNPSRVHRQHLSYVGGVNGTYFGGSETDNASHVIWPVYRGVLTGTPANDAANSNAYAWAGGGVLFPIETTSMSKWCAQCHDNWHEGILPSNRLVYADEAPYTIINRDWLRHPVATFVPKGASPGCALDCHPSLLDRANYSAGLIQAGKGIPVTMKRYSLAPLGPEVYYLPWAAPDNSMANAGDVFCLSCHFAHGGPYYDALRWNYTSDVSAGDQTGNEVPSNKGCQLCHNR